MNFRLDKHGQLRILCTEDIQNHIDKGEPDVLVFSVEETDALRGLLEVKPEDQVEKAKSYFERWKLKVKGK